MILSKDSAHGACYCETYVVRTITVKKKLIKSWHDLRTGVVTRTPYQ